MFESLEPRVQRFPLGAAVTLDELRTDPSPVLARLRADEPISWVPALGSWLITSRDLAVDAMRDAETFTVDDPRFSTAAVLGTSMLSLDGAEHERHRAPFAPSFRPTVVRDQFEMFLVEEANRLVSEIVDSGGGNIRTQLAGPLAVNTIVRFLGLDDVRADAVLHWYAEVSDAIVGIASGVDVPDSCRAVVAEIATRVEQTISNGAEHLLARLVADGRLSADELVTETVVVMFGAIETSEGMTANALRHLLLRPELTERVRANRSLVPDVVEESLRLEPAAAVVDRYATRSLDFGGASIVERDLVEISLLGANRDPVVFEHPDDFVIDRPNVRQHVTFVQGPHGCLGLHLARLETVAAINAVLDAGLFLDARATTPPSGLIFRKPNSVIVTLGGPSVGAQGCRRRVPDRRWQTRPCWRLDRRHR